MPVTPVIKQLNLLCKISNVTSIQTARFFFISHQYFHVMLVIQYTKMHLLNQRLEGEQALHMLKLQFEFQNFSEGFLM